MVRRLFASRSFLSIVGALLVGAVAAAAAFAVMRPDRERIDYCAILPDSIGLYVGNEVSLRGITVGEVKDIRAEGSKVRVDFRIDASHSLRAQTTAATVSDTLVADRRLALNDSGDRDWNPDDCITETATPKSITQTLDSLAALADQLDGGDDPTQRGRIRAAVAEFDRATAGTGPQLNDIVTRLASALRSPDASIGRIGTLIDTVSSLSQSVTDGWGGLSEMLNGLSPVLQLVNQVWERVVLVVQSFTVLLPWLNDMSTKYSGPMPDLQTSSSFLDLVSARIGTMEKLLDLTPVVAHGFQAATDPESGRVIVTYAAPRVELAPPVADHVCSAINAVTTDKCVGAGAELRNVDLSMLVLSLIGGAR